jgi:uncharacterized coiled-coil protein SlyX
MGKPRNHPEAPTGPKPWIHSTVNHQEPGRITKSRKRQRKESVTFTGTSKIPTFEFSGGGEGRATNLDEIAWLIANLKETISQQNRTIETVRTGLTEVKKEQQNLKNQNVELQEEIRALRTQLSNNPLPRPSWASVVASQSPVGSGASVSGTTRTESSG